MKRWYSSSRVDEGSKIIKGFLTGSSSLQKQLGLLGELVGNFNVPENTGLPLSKPQDMPSPFQFYSTVNSDPSYIKIPRLSVTKLLVSLWCELRDFYRVYSGSPMVTKTPQMERGTEVHLKLEQDTHEEIDTSGLEFYVQSLLETADVSDVPCSPIESEIATDWCERIIGRLFTLVTTSEAREVLVHGYLDLETGKVVCDENATLISGVIDLLKIYNADDALDYSLFTELQQNIEYEFPNNRLDMPRFFELAKSVIDAHKDNYTSMVSDIKTRSFNHLPSQQSVLEAARYQVGIYRKFTGVLAGEAYNMLLQNAKLRQADLDKPIEFSTALRLLRKFPHLLYSDYTRLAQGMPLQFASYDGHSTLKGTYPLDEIVHIPEFIELMKQECYNDMGFDYASIVTEEIIKNWKTPLTLRYFAARAAQFFELLQPVLGPSTSVEYYNSKTGKAFETKHYKYDDTEIGHFLQHAASFWSGERQPNAVDDLSKCKYCEFSKQCCIPHPNLKVPHYIGTVGSQINEFLR